MESENYMIKILQPKSEEAQDWQGQFMVLISVYDKANYFGFHEISVIEAINV